MYKKEIDGITLKFLKRYQDQELEDEVSRGEEPFDITRISSFKVVMLKANKDLMSDSLDKERELSDRVRESSKEELLHKIDLDMDTIREYRKELISKNRDRQGHAKRYKDTRYVKGLEMVQSKMDDTFYIAKVDKIDELTQHIGTLKTRFSKIRLGPCKDVYPPPRFTMYDVTSHV